MSNTSIKSQTELAQSTKKVFSRSSNVNFETTDRPQRSVNASTSCRSFFCKLLCRNLYRVSFPKTVHCSQTAASSSQHMSCSKEQCSRSSARTVFWANTLCLDIMVCLCTCWQKKSILLQDNVYLFIGESMAAYYSVSRRFIAGAAQFLTNTIDLFKNYTFDSQISSCTRFFADWHRLLL